MFSESVENVVTTGQQQTFYFEAGDPNGPVIIFIHGWPELSISWRHQLPVMASLGFRAIAPDMRGYGRSTVYENHEDYAQEKVVGDMISLLEIIDRFLLNGLFQIIIDVFSYNLVYPPIIFLAY